MKDFKRWMAVFGFGCIMLTGCGIRIGEKTTAPEDSQGDTLHSLDSTETETEQDETDTNSSHVQAESSQSTEYDFYDYNNAFMGGAQTPKHLLNAENLEQKNIDYSMAFSIDEFLKPTEFYSDAYGKLISDIFEQHDNGTILEGSEGFYISGICIRSFHVHMLGVYRNPALIIFSDDLSEAVIYTLYYHDVDGTGAVEPVEAILSSGEQELECIEFMKQNPYEPYIWIQNASNTHLLGQDNTLYCLGDVECEVMGDYFHTLDSEALAVTYAELADMENLVWVSFDE